LSLLLAALRARAAEWDILWLRDMPLAPLEQTAFRAAVAAAGLEGALRPWDLAPYLDTTAGWADYLARRSANFRSDLKRKRRRLEEAGPVTIERHRDPAALEAALAEAAAIEAASWKAEAGTARMAEPRGLAFFRAAAAALAAAGQAELWVLRCGGPAVAFYLNFLEENA